MSFPINRALPQTLEEVIRGAPAHFIEHYGKDRHHRAKVSNLENLVWPFTATQVDEIIGNTTWTALKCDLCRTPVDAVVRVDTSHGEYSPTAICTTCLDHMQGLINP